MHSSPPQVGTPDPGTVAGNAVPDPDQQAPLVPVRVWDLPTRGFHWALFVCVSAAVVSAQIGGNAMVWHMRFGLAIGALLVFRLVWGVVGGRWSRFSSFLRSPAATWRYLRGASLPDEHHDVGHNPLGSWSVVALLGLLLAQVLTGAVADDEISFTGPLISQVTASTSLLATRLHKTVGQYGLYFLVAMHLGAIIFYRVRRGKNLVKPMLSGDKLLPPHTPASADHAARRWLAAALFSLCCGGAAWVSSLGT